MLNPETLIIKVSVNPSYRSKLTRPNPLSSGKPKKKEGMNITLLELCTKFPPQPTFICYFFSRNHQAKQDMIINSPNLELVLYKSINPTNRITEEMQKP